MIRHPTRMRPPSACLHLSLTNTFTRAHCVSGSLSSLCVSLALTASMFIFMQELIGLPVFSNVSLPTCHGLRTPSDIQQPHVAPPDNVAVICESSSAALTIAVTSAIDVSLFSISIEAFQLDEVFASAGNISFLYLLEVSPAHHPETF